MLEILSVFQLERRITYTDTSVNPDNRGNCTLRENEHSTSIPLTEVAMLLDELRFSPLRASGSKNISEGYQRHHCFVGRWDVKSDGHTSVNDFLERVQGTITKICT